jgi:hypothetical protein
MRQNCIYARNIRVPYLGKAASIPVMKDGSGVSGHGAVAVTPECALAFREKSTSHTK